MARPFFPRSQGIARHAAETLRLASPLAVAQLAQMAMGVTDTVLLGAVGGEALAAGGLGASLFFTAVILMQGVLTSVSILVAQALGAGRKVEVPELYWTGLLLALLLVAPAFLLFSVAEPALLALGEPARLAADFGAYLRVLRWGAPGALIGLGLMRAFLPAVNQGAMLQWVALGSAVANGLLCYGLIHGTWGLPALGLLGSALSSVLVLWGAAAALLLLVHLRPAVRETVGWHRPRTRVLGAMLRLGGPVSATFAVEAGLFVAVGLLVGLLGPAPLAAQQVALSVLSVAFMVPLAVAQAANVRVGHYVGGRDFAGARRAGLVAIGLGAAFEVAAAVVLLAMPKQIVGLYLDRAAPGNAEAFAIAVDLLGVAVMFQVADGVQSVAAGALRGLGDTRVPFLIAAFGYWGLGFPAAWWLTMRGGWGAAGAWWGLAVSLIAVAALLTRRFVRQSSERCNREAIVTLP